MAELTQNGLLIRRYPEIREAIVNAIQQRSSADLLFDEATILGQIVSILAQEQSLVEQVLQSIYSSLDRDKAEGTTLDSLLALVGLTRLPATASSTESLLVSAPDNTTISTNFIVENPSNGDRYRVTNAKLLSPALCRGVTYEVESLPVSFPITLTINQIEYTFTSDLTPTPAEIVNGLADEINADAVATWSATVNAQNHLIIVSDDENEIQVAIADTLAPIEVNALLPIEAEETGPIKAPANTITKAITPTTIFSVTNLEDIGIGRDRETDEEFRLRASQSLAVSGSATYSAMLAAMLNLSQITSVAIEENETNSTNALGLPPHSFEVIVNAPDNEEVNQAIAKTIWDEKPLGIQSYGNTTVQYVDEGGIARTINFSRSSNQIIAVRVSYNLYEEEVLTTGVQTAIRKAVLDYGNSLVSGKDVIPRKFAGPIYDATSGLDEVIVQVQVIAQSGATPSPSNWTEARVAIGPSQIATFNSADIHFVEL